MSSPPPLQAYFYTWSYFDDPGNNCSIIRGYAYAPAEEIRKKFPEVPEGTEAPTDLVNIMIRIEDFPMICYLELPTEVSVKGKKKPIEWSVMKLTSVMDELKKRFPSSDHPVAVQLVKRRKTYHVHKNPKTMEDILFPFAKLTMPTFGSMEKLSRACSADFNIPLIGGSFKLKPREHAKTLTPLIRLYNYCDLPPVGWIDFEGARIGSSELETTLDLEFACSYKKMKRSARDDLLLPNIISFDNEANSHIHSAMPNATHPLDRNFQIGIVTVTSEKKERVVRKYLFSLGKVKKIKPSADGIPIEIREFKTEAELICELPKFVREHNFHVIIGYNILGWDVNYMISRTKEICKCFSSFTKFGCIPSAPDKVAETVFSSSAYGKNKFVYLETEGRLWIDVLPVLKRDYKFPDFTLKTVSTELLGKEKAKDPLTKNELFELYDSFTPEGLSRIGKYCVQDAYSTYLIYEELQLWITLVETSKVCHVPIPYNFLKGQQIRLVSLVYEYHIQNKIVMELSPQSHIDDSFKGATVKDPIKGFWTYVTVVDFSGLYPSIMQAYNIDHSTYDELKEIDEKYIQKFIWEEHENCKHDPHRKKSGKVLCGDYEYHFLKPEVQFGIIPTILKTLVGKRKEVKAQMEKFEALVDEETDPVKKKEYKLMATITKKKQLAFKVVCNSSYGMCGAKHGMLPNIEGAMTVTSTGRKSIAKAKKFIEDTFGGTIVYIDTDSLFIVFEQPEKAEMTIPERFELARKMEKEVSSIFPKPMKMDFEGTIYDKIFMLSKKRYFYTTVGYDEKTGKIKHCETLKYKGCCLSRRNYCDIVKTLFKTLAADIFAEKDSDVAITHVLETLEKIFTLRVPHKEFTITASIKEFSDYRGKSLPAHAQLAQRMIKRGLSVPAGSRIRYIFIDQGEIGLSKKKILDAQRVEDYDYFLRNRDVLRVDYLIYIKKQFVNTIDEVLNIAYHLNNFMEGQYHLRIQKQLVMNEIKKLGRREIVIDE